MPCRQLSVCMYVPKPVSQRTPAKGVEYRHLQDDVFFASDLPTVVKFVHIIELLCENMQEAWTSILC